MTPHYVGHVEPRYEYGKGRFIEAGDHINVSLGPYWESPTTKKRHSQADTGRFLFCGYTEDHVGSGFLVVRNASREIMLPVKYAETSVPLDGIVRRPYKISKERK